MRKSLKAALLLASLMLTGVSLTACETAQNAWEGARDTVD